MALTVKTAAETASKMNPLELRMFKSHGVRLRPSRSTHAARLKNAIQNGQLKAKLDVRERAAERGEQRARHREAYKQERRQDEQTLEKFQTRTKEERRQSKLAQLRSCDPKRTGSTPLEKSARRPRAIRTHPCRTSRAAVRAARHCFLAPLALDDRPPATIHTLAQEIL